jgi:hypothetical protein
LIILTFWVAAQVMKLLLGAMEGARVAGLGALDVRQGQAVGVQIGVGDAAALLTGLGFGAGE